jgi:hypothetical protein
MTSYCMNTVFQLVLVQYAQQIQRTTVRVVIHSIYETVIDNILVTMHDDSKNADHINDSYSVKKYSTGRLQY